MEEVVSHRRVEIQSFFEKLVSCRLWGRVCTCDTMKDLLGITENSSFSRGRKGAERPYLFQPHNIVDLFNGADPSVHSAKVDEEFEKLVSPLFSLGFVTVFKKSKNTITHIETCI